MPNKRYYIRLERLAIDKHSSLLVPFISYEEKSAVNMALVNGAKWNHIEWITLILNFMCKSFYVLSILAFNLTAKIF
jgi:hypothetical protein